MSALDSLISADVQKSKPILYKMVIRADIKVVDGNIDSIFMAYNVWLILRRKAIVLKVLNGTEKQGKPS